MISINTKYISVVLAGCFFVITSITAQSSESRDAVLEEVIVTAQKRQQSVADVPISVSVIGGKFIASQGITDVQDVLMFSANVKLQEESGVGTAGGVTPSCRGFKVDQSNRSFEAPCGISLDGIPYARTAYFGAAIFDIERVEVLRGPQGTTFGKNTTAGLVHLITKDPSEAFEGYVDVQDGELDRSRVEMAVGGPIIAGKLSYRISGVQEERTGYLTNTTANVVPEANRKQGSRDREAFRVKIDVLDIFGLDTKITYEKADLFSEGTTGEWYDLSPQMEAFLRQYDPNADFIKGNFRNSSDVPTQNEIAIERYQIDANYIINDWAITGILGFSELNNDIVLDLFGTPAPLAELEQSDKNPAKTLETRVASPLLNGLFGIDSLFNIPLGESEFLAGVFLQNSDLTPSELTSTVDTIALGGFLAATEEESSALPPALLAATPFALTGELASEFGLGEEFIHMVYNEKRETKAIFGQFAWYITPSVSIEIGARYSEEEKEADWVQTLSDPAPLHEQIGWEDFTAQRTIKSYSFQPKYTISYKPTDNISTYLHWAKGFKGGGFNTFTQSPDDEIAPLEYGPETVEEWGLDIKMSFLEGRLKVNNSIYDMNLDQFQVLIGFEGPGGPLDLRTVVRNAGEASVKGAESDITYSISPSVQVIAALGYNDAKYIDHRFGSCPPGEIDSDGDGHAACDHSGKRFSFSPKWNGSITFLGDFSLDMFGMSEIYFAPSLTTEFYSDQIMHDNLSEKNRVDDYYQFKLSAAVKSPVNGWSIRVLVDNLTNIDVPTSKNVADYGSIQNVRSPRTIYGQLRYNF